MFYKTKVNILDGSFTKIGEALVDLQAFNQQMTFEDNITLHITKRAFCDIVLLNIFCYMQTDNALYKVMDIKQWDDYLELLLYECEANYAER